MNSTAVGILSHPEPCSHIVYSCADASKLADAVCLFTTMGLRNGEAVLLVMTEAHSRPVLNRISADGFNVGNLLASGQLVYQEAERLLASFMFDGIIDEHKFKTTVGMMITQARATCGGRGVRVFGEMVDLIWRSKLRATERLEELWNDVIQQHSVPLLCAYALTGTESEAFPPALLACHSHAVAEA